MKSIIIKSVLGGLSLSVILLFQNCSEVDFSTLSGSIPLVNPEVHDNGVPDLALPEDDVPSDHIPPCMICDTVIDDDGERSYPSKETLATAVFEDQYPNQGDADYNDMVFNFRVTEKINPQNEIYEIDILIVPRPYAAGNVLGLILAADGIAKNSNNLNEVNTAELFKGTGRIDISWKTPQGDIIKTGSFNKDENIELIDNQKNASVALHGNLQQDTPKYTIHIKVILDFPSLNPVTSNPIFNLARLRLFARNKSTGYDIDLYETNTDFSNSNGYPFGLVVPHNWAYPKETVHISNAYPYFANLVNWIKNGRVGELSEDGANWFLHLEPSSKTKVYNGLSISY